MANRDMSGMEFHRVDFNSVGDQHLVLVPGILTRVPDQYGALKGALDELGLLVSGFDYLGSYFDADACVKALTELIDRNISIKQKTILFGSSLGGMLIARALAVSEAKHGAETLNKWVSTVLVDSPSAPDDLVVPLRAVMAWLTRHFVPRERANEGYGRRLLSLFRVPPKEEETELTPGTSFADIKAAAIAGLTGHKFTMWWTQLRWMLNERPLGLEALDGLQVTYIACVKGNGTVRQPQAQEAYAPHVRRVVEVEGPHCGYLQMQTTWSRVLHEVLA